MATVAQQARDDYLTPTQIGAVGVSIVAARLIASSEGRLCPFLPVADDGGVDLLMFDKKTRHAVPVQVKTRTVELKRFPNLVHFQVRKKTFSETPGTVVVAMLLDWGEQKPRVMWLLPNEVVAREARSSGGNYVLRPSKAPESQDKWTQFRCASFEELAQRLVILLETEMSE
jgi:hypothetical protein